MSSNDKEKVPETDVKSGMLINPHNPEFLTKVPWYLGESTGPTLSHLKKKNSDHELTLSETDAIAIKKVMMQKAIQEKSKTEIKVYKKGACKNCGALTHKEKDCVERPRSQKKAAWKSGLDIAPDEVVIKLEDHGKVTFDAKRDLYQGYNPEDYNEVIEKHRRMDQIRQSLKQEKDEKMKLETQEKRRIKALNNDNINDINNISDDSDSDYDSDSKKNDEYVQNDADAKVFTGRSGNQGGLGGAGMKNTIANLRIREDTPKYLYNLALDSAHYDPKTRSMRANPNIDKNPDDGGINYVGDNFLRATGDALKLAQNQVLCWDMQAKGIDVDIMTNPSQAELMLKQYNEKKIIEAQSTKDAIIAEYNSEHFINKSLDPRLKLGQTEIYMEYSKDGRVLKGPEKVKARTKYEEDVYVFGHASVWGSYYNKIKRCWGYSCCHAISKNDYCTGAKGKIANDEFYGMNHVPSSTVTIAPKKVIDTERPQNTQLFNSRSELYGEMDSSVSAKIDKEKVNKLLEKINNDKADTDKKRKSTEVSLEEMEAYRLTKLHRDDPMAKYIGQQDDQ